MAGILIKADESGVTILNGMADGVEHNSQSIIEQTKQMRDEIDQYQALGPHKDQLLKILEDIEEAVKNVAAPAAVVAEKLREKAQEYQEWIDMQLGSQGN